MIFMFIDIITMFQLMGPLAFFRCFIVNSAAFLKFRTELFIFESLEADSSKQVNHKRVHVLSHNKYSL